MQEWRIIGCILLAFPFFWRVVVYFKVGELPEPLYSMPQQWYLQILFYIFLAEPSTGKLRMPGFVLLA